MGKKTNVSFTVFPENFLFYKFTVFSFRFRFFFSYLSQNSEWGNATSNFLPHDFNFSWGGDWGKVLISFTITGDDMVLITNSNILIVYLSNKTMSDFSFENFTTEILTPLFLLKKTRKLYNPLIWIGFNCLKVERPQRGVSLFLTNKSQGVRGKYLIELGRMKY